MGRFCLMRPNRVTTLVHTTKGNIDMKKLLLGTTTLVGAAALFAGSAFAAETPKVTVGGFADFQAAYTDEDLDAGTRSHTFRSDTEITFRVDGITDSGMLYGAGIDLEADTTADVDGQGVNASKTFVYVGGDYGRFEMGSNLMAQQTLKIGAESIARASGGIDGDWYNFMTAPAVAGTFIATPDLPINYGFAAPAGTFPAGTANTVFGSEATENLNNVTYYTPRFAGFQLGVSYAPDNGTKGQLANRVDAAASADNIFSGGVNYEGQFRAFTLGLSATGEVGESTVAGLEDLQAWQAGGKIGYMGFVVAGSYGDWGDSLSATGADDSDFWTVGGAYEFGPFAASVTYLESNYDLGATENEFENLSFGVDYKLAPGLTPYAEVSFVDADGAGALDNEATVVIAGTQLAF